MIEADSTCVTNMLNKLNINLHEIIDVIDILLLGFENDKINSNEMVISCISVLKKLIKEAVCILNDEMNRFEGTT
jgi:hypothetical protein